MFEDLPANVISDTDFLEEDDISTEFWISVDLSSEDDIYVVRDEDTLPV